MGRCANEQSTVLLVEDEPLQRAHLEHMILAAGFDVLPANNAKKALSLLEDRPDICAVITDIRMPGGLDGLVVAWRAAKRVPARSIIVISAYMVAGPNEQPAQDFRFFRKPIQANDLIQEIRLAVRRTQAVTDFKAYGPAAIQRLHS